MSYPITTMGGLGDATPTAPPAPAPFYESSTFKLLAGVAIGLAAGYLQWGRKRRR